MRTALPFVLLAASCAASSGASPHRSGWVTEIVHQAPDKLGACVVGDVDPTSAGDEIVTVCRSGQVFVAARSSSDPGGWRVREIGRTPGEMIQVAVGELLADRPGLEIVAVGAAEGPEADLEPGAAWLFAREPGGDGWSARRIHGSERLLHAVTVHDGRVLAGGYDEELTLIELDGDGARARSLGALPGPAKCAASAAGATWIACKDGSVVVAREDVSGWSLDVLHERDAGRARLGVHGGRLAVCDDDGVLSLVTVDGESEVVHREGDKLRGAVLADLDPSVPGPELATAGYERRLTILSRVAGDWMAVPVLVETDKFHGLAAGDVDGDGEAEVVACGYSGRLVVIDRFAGR